MKHLGWNPDPSCKPLVCTGFLWQDPVIQFKPFSPFHLRGHPSSSGSLAFPFPCRWEKWVCLISVRPLSSYWTPLSTKVKEAKRCRIETQIKWIERNYVSTRSIQRNINPEKFLKTWSILVLEKYQHILAVLSIVQLLFHFLNRDTAIHFRVVMSI